jgi:uncharacterized protein (TIGR03437 family)
MTKQFLSLFLCALITVSALARTERTICGSHQERAGEGMFLHRRSVLALKNKSAVRTAATPAASRDAGNIIVLEDSDGVIARRNVFAMDKQTLRFQPESGKYQYDVRAGVFDAAAAAGGTALSGFGDDDSRKFALPFAFPFYGTVYRDIFVNSDGNLTFGEGDSASAERSLGRMTSGPPRISPLYEDLDATNSQVGVRVVPEASRWVASWNAVPEYAESGSGRSQTFQVILYPDGKIEFSYSGIATSGAVVGIAPGRLQGGTSVVSFSTASSASYAGAVVERYGGADELDIVTASQKILENHDDAFDYLVFYNNMGVAIPSAVAQYTPVRNSRTGMGDAPADDGAEYGSPRRLQGVMNMGRTEDYPLNPNGAVSLRFPSGDTPLTVLGHEASHMFLAYVSVREPGSPDARPMLSPDLFHWSFRFNAEASILAGNRIRDNGTDATARFTTTGAVESYSPLDQYLMGLRQPEEVPPTFYVKDPAPSSIAARPPIPQVGVNFNGTRRDVTIEELIATEGRRRPDATVSQRQYRFGFVLIVAAGTTPGDSQLQQIETYRTSFETAFSAYTGGRASADTSLRKGVRLSLWPMSGVMNGKTIAATLAVPHALTSALTFTVKTANGNADSPGPLAIVAGAKQVSFNIHGLRPGVEEFSFAPSDPAFETAYARVQVQDNNMQSLALKVVSGDAQAAVASKPLDSPVVVKLSDVNHVPYSGIRVSANVSTGGALDAASAITDENGQARFKWTPTASPLNELILSAENSASVTAVALGRPDFSAAGLVNAASFQSAVAPGSIATIFGVNLVGVKIAVGGSPAQVFYASNRQVNFLVPANVPAGFADVIVTNAVGVAPSVKVTLQPVAPGTFFDSGTGFGAVMDRGQRIFEVYATGLGAAGSDGMTVQKVEASAGGLEAQVLYSGLAPGFPGLYQVNVKVADAVTPGTQNLILRAGGLTSNTVKIAVR